MRIVVLACLLVGVELWLPPFISTTVTQGKVSGLMRSIPELTSRSRVNCENPFGAPNFVVLLSRTE